MRGVTKLSNSSKKINVNVIQADFGEGFKKWIQVEHIGGSNIWIPSFEDLFRMIQPICEIEDTKYPPKKGFKGRKMVEEFLVDSCRSNVVYEELAKKYMIPKREWKQE